MSRFLLDLYSASQRPLVLDSKGEMTQTTTQNDTVFSSRIDFEPNVDAFATSIIPGEGTGDAPHDRFNNDIASIRIDREESLAAPEQEGDEETAEKPGLDGKVLTREASKDSDAAMCIV